MCKITYFKFLLVIFAGFPTSTMRKFFFCLTFFFSVNTVFAQFLETKFDVESEGILFLRDRSPFWMHSNKYGRLDEKSNIFTLLRLKNEVLIDSDQVFEIVAGGLFKNGFENEIRFDEVYFEYRSPKIGFFVGKKHRKDHYQGLSVSNESILRSLNAPAFPGIGIYSIDPLYLFGDHGPGVMASLEEYLLDDQRYIEDTRVHHKSFHFVYKSEYPDFRIDLGVQHYVQWAGKSEEFGVLPKSFEDYIRIFSGMASDEDVGNGQEVNALGNQIGSYEAKVKANIRDVDFELIYNHIFEDASGMKMGNFPDGRYAIYIEDNRDAFWSKSWLKAFMYEFHYTKNQSRARKSSAGDGADNYFNNNLYRSGWTYQNRVIGSPFILPNENRFRIGRNIVVAHHVGIRGEILKDIPYKFLLSYRENYGVKDSFLAQKEQIFSGLIEVEILNSDYLLHAQLGVDAPLHDQLNIGVGLNFRKTIF